MPWLELLRAAVALSTQREVAHELGFSPTTVNQVLKGTYTASPARLAARVLARYNHPLHCHHLQREIAGSECVSFRTRPIPTSSHHALDHWAACQACPNKPKEKA